MKRFETVYEYLKECKLMYADVLVKVQNQGYIQQKFKR